MNSISERGILRPEGTKRIGRNALRGIAAAAIVVALSGCTDEALLPPGVQPGTKPQATVEPQVQEPPMQMSKEDAEDLAGAAGLITIGSLLIFLTGRRRG